MTVQPPSDVTHTPATITDNIETTYDLHICMTVDPPSDDTHTSTTTTIDPPSKLTKQNNAL